MPGRIIIINSMLCRQPLCASRRAALATAWASRRAASACDCSCCKNSEVAGSIAPTGATEPDPLAGKTCICHLHHGLGGFSHRRDGVCDSLSLFCNALRRVCSRSCAGRFGSTLGGSKRHSGMLGIGTGADALW